MVAHSDGESVPLASVVYEGPHGAEGLLITPAMGPAVPFGRGGSCPIRFGHGPDIDPRLARRAGALVVAGDRIAVESSAEPGHLPVQVVPAGRPPVELSQGELYAPATAEFEVIVRGERVWTVTVRTAAPRAQVDGGPVPDGPLTEHPRLVLTSHEREVLAAYVAPLRDGGYEPATHGDVAERFHFSVSKVRGDLYGIWSKMVAAGLPVPGYTDKRIAVARTALANGLV